MHVFPNDTHPLSLSLGPMGDISVHASVVAHDTTLDNSNHPDARYIPQNIISIAAHDTSLEMHSILSTHSFSTHITLITPMPQNNADYKFTQIIRR